MTRPERIGRADECGATDGYSTCTEPPGHAGNTHWDEHTQQEWLREDGE